MGFGMESIFLFLDGRNFLLKFFLQFGSAFYKI